VAQAEVEDIGKVTLKGIDETYNLMLYKNKINIKYVVIKKKPLTLYVKS
jgi:hypothetical protein